MIDDSDKHSSADAYGVKLRPVNKNCFLVGILKIV